MEAPIGSFITEGLRMTTDLKLTFEELKFLQRIFGVTTLWDTSHPVFAGLKQKISDAYNIAEYENEHPFIDWWREFNTELNDLGLDEAGYALARAYYNERKAAKEAANAERTNPRGINTGSPFPY